MRFDIPLACVGIMFVLIYVPRVLVLRGQTKQPEGLDNNNPRDQQQRLTGAAKRANAAHANSFESFAPFAAAVIVAELTGANHRWLTILSLGYIVARALYPVLYIANIASPRSLVWMVSFGCTVGIFVLPMLS